jgi:hypothetical protein
MDTIAIKMPFNPMQVVADSLFWFNKMDSIQARHMKLFWRANDLYLQDLIEYQNFINYRNAKKKKYNYIPQDSIVIDSNVTIRGVGLSYLELMEAKAYTENSTQLSKR